MPRVSEDLRRRTGPAGAPSGAQPMSRGAGTTAGSGAPDGVRSRGGYRTLAGEATVSGVLTVRSGRDRSSRWQWCMAMALRANSRIPVPS